MDFKVAMSDTLFPDLEIEKSVLKNIDAELHLANNNTPDAIILVAKDADALVAVYAEITDEVISNLEKCKVIVRTGIGVDNVDIKSATEKGIYVANVPDYCWDEVSEHAISLAFALARKIFILDKNAKKGNWDMGTAKPIFRFRGQTFGLIGFGNIAKFVAKKLQVFGFKMVAYDPFISQEQAGPFGVEMLGLEQLLNVSDIVSIHCPLLDSTYHLLDDKAFSLMKRTSFLVNTARGPIVDKNALINALKSAKIAGAALDVLEGDPPDKSDEILSFDNLILTPHAAFYSDQSSIDLRKLAFEEVVRVLQGNKPKNLVNKELLK